MSPEAARRYFQRLADARRARAAAARREAKTTTDPKLKSALEDLAQVYDRQVMSYEMRRDEVK